MGLFDKMKKTDDNISFPEPPGEDIKPAYPEPPKPMSDLASVKEKVEAPAYEKEEDVEEKDEDLESDIEVSEPEFEPEKQEFKPKWSIPEPSMPTTINPTLYLKLSEYKEVVEATNRMRKDIEKAKELISELRLIEKDEHSKLEKSEELIKDIDKIVSLFEKTMVTPIE